MNKDAINSPNVEQIINEMLDKSGPLESLKSVTQTIQEKYPEITNTHIRKMFIRKYYN
jgi:hypothetical protein